MVKSFLRDKSTIFIGLSCLLIILFFQNCSQIDTQKNESANSKSNLSDEIGNGGGYTGIDIDAPMVMKPGDEVIVSIVGGVGPFILNASHPDVSIFSSNDEDKFVVHLASTTKILSFTLHAADSKQNEIFKSIWVYILEVPELNSSDQNSSAGEIGAALGINDEYAVMSGHKWGDETYGQWGIFSFRHVDNEIKKLNKDLLGSQYPEHMLRVLDLNNNYLLTGNSIRRVGNQQLVGSASLYHLENGVPKLIDYLLPSKIISNSHFGADVSLYNDEFVVGSPFNGLGDGRVYYYSILGSLSELKQVILSPGAPYIDFGRKVKVTKNQLFAISQIRKQNENYSPTYLTSAVHVYKHNHASNSEWQPEAIVHLPEFPKQDWRLCGHTFDATDDYFFTVCHRRGYNTFETYLYIFMKEEKGWRLTQTIELQNDTFEYFNHQMQHFSYLSADDNLLAVTSNFNAQKEVLVYRLDIDQKKYVLWKRIALEQRLFDQIDTIVTTTQVSLWNDKVLISVKSIYKAFALLIDLKQVPDLQIK